MRAAVGAAHAGFTPSGLRVNPEPEDLFLTPLSVCRFGPRNALAPLAASNVYICTCSYIYIYMYIDLFIRERERGGGGGGGGKVGGGGGKGGGVGWEF